MQFSLSAAQVAQIEAWRKAQDQAVLESQRQTLSPAEFKKSTGGGQHPYYGAIGGELTYSFAPNSLGLAITVQHALTGEVLDVTDYASW